MKVLADVNVLLAIADPQHSAHGKVTRWFDSMPAGKEILLCRVTQTSLLRVLAISSVMQGKPFSLKEAWAHVDAVMASPGIGFAHESPGVESIWRKLCSPFAASPKVVADAYLAAFALQDDLQMATMDRGFRQFAKLRVVEALLHD